VASREPHAACAHDCGAPATVEHADGRALCRPCYDAEVDVTHGNPGCPTCGPAGTVGVAACGHEIVTADEGTSHCPTCETEARAAACTYDKEGTMANEATIVDPRVIAATLQMDTYQFAETLTGWAADSLPSIGFEERKSRGPSSLEAFDEQVEKARRYLEAAHEAFAAYLADNPEDDGDDA